MAETGNRPLEHEDSGAAPAPGELELVRSFLSLHDHEPGKDESFPPTPASLEAWLRSDRLLEKGEPARRQDLRWALDILDALRTKVFENMGAAPDLAAGKVLTRAAHEAGVRPDFAEPVALRPSAPGIKGVIGRMLAASFLAEIDGSWEHLKECGSPTCRSVFFDRSKNHSGRWCSMQSCGNRAKVRAFRDRARGD